MSEYELIAIYIGLGTVVGSLLGAFISTLLARSHKISSFRQEWINSVREILAEILSQSEKFTDVAYKNDQESYKEKIKLVAVISKAKLFLNVGEQASGNLITRIESIPNEYMALEGGSTKFSNERPEFEKLMQEILKEEWNRVRDGEILWQLKKLFKPGGFLQEFYCSRLSVIFLLIASIILFTKLALCT